MGTSGNIRAAGTDAARSARPVHCRSTGSERAHVERRIFGLENEYGVTCTLRGQRRLSPDEVARYLFRRVVSWGRSSNVFLENGARLYLDVGSHPEYATPECDSIYDLVVHDKAGERILESLVQSAEQRLREEGIRGEVFLFKNNTDSAGNSYGCHENYLVERDGDFSKFTDVLIPFLVSRQIYAGAGKVLQTARGAMYCIAQRAEHIWEGVSSATTRSRPIINTRDEPHADAERFRRLHVIVGDSNMSEYATFLKVGATSIILRMLEEDGAPWRDLTLENPIRAIREISHDVTCRRRVRLANGRELSAVEIQSEYLTRALRFAKRRGLPPLEKRALEMWEHVMTHLEQDPLKLTTEVDWVIKYHLIEAYRKRGDLPLTHPRVALLDLAYHDVTRARSLYYLLERRDQVERIVTDEEIATAVTTPPQTHARPAARRVHQAGQGTQARLHGRLGAPEAQRPGPAHRALQGPVQVARRTRRAPDRQPVGRARALVPDRRDRPRLLEERPGLQRVEVDLGDGAERAYVLTQLTGRVDVGDAGRREHDRGRARARHRRLARRALEPRRRDVVGAGPRPHHQGALHEPAGRRRQHRGALARARRHRLDRRACRSSPPRCTASSPRSRSRSSSARPDARLAYVMTDGAALPLALSDLVVAAPARASSSTRRSPAGTRSAATTKRSRCTARSPSRDRIVARRRRRRRRWGRASSAPRPGSASRGIEVGPILDAAAGLQGTPIACLRASFADPRERHRGVSHHSATALTIATRSSVLVPLATVGGDEEARLRDDLDASGIDGAARDRRRRADRHRRARSRRTTSTSSRWAGPRPTTRCCSRWPPRPAGVPPHAWRAP